MTGPAAPPAPRRCSDLIGHDAAERQMLAAWLSGRMPHAWLITGPGGIGKATLAYRFARFVLAHPAPHRQTAGLFGAPPPPASLAVAADHPVAVRVAAAGHADLLSVERRFDDDRGRLRRDIAVDDVRRIAPFLHLTPAEADWRVVVVDGAERMNNNSQNAILKILEEPPAGALLLLVAENGGALKPTIRSRCRRLALAPLPDAAVTTLLAQHRPDLAAADRAALAGLAEGSVGRALDLAQAGGLDLYRELMALLGQMPRFDVAVLHGFADKLARRGAETAYATATELLIWWLARLVRALAVGSAPAEVISGEAELIRRLGPSGSLERWMEVWDKLNQLFAGADAASLDRKQVLLNAFLTLETAV